MNIIRSIQKSRILNYLNQASQTNKTTKAIKTTNYTSLALLLTLTSILPILLPATATAAPSTPPDSCFNFNSGTGTITNYYDYEYDNNSNPACTREPIIPSTIGGNSVTSIGDYAFYINQLTSVTIPNSVIAIDNGAFSSNQLTSITIPNSVTSIGNEVFRYNQLTSVTIEGNITTAGSNVFSGNPIQTFTYGLDTYTPSDPLTEDCFAFDGSNTITSFNWADIATIRDHSNACLNPSVNIPSTIDGNSVTAIGNSAFEGNQLTSVIIPNSVTVIGDMVFLGNKISTIILPDSNLEIGMQAFFGNELSVVIIPSTVNSVGAMAFAGQVVVGGVGYMDVNNAIVSNDPDLVSIAQSSINSIVVTQIYADNPDVLGLTDAFMTEADFGVGDMNNDGDTTDIFSAQLINPARITASYKDTEGNTIAPSATYTGTGLSSYLAVDNPTNNLNLYYKAGNSYTVPPAPAIAGYTIQTTPSNIANLTAGNNSIDYIYTANSNNNDNNNNENNNPNTSNLTTPTSPISAFSLRPVSLTTPTGTNITSSSTVPESSLVTQDNNNQYPLGLVNFSFTTNQTNNQVTLDFITDLKPNQVTPRKYNSNTNSYNNLPTNANPIITETTIDNKHALTLTYTLIDNGELDLDPTTGIIKDPVGLAVSNQTYDQLANTGETNTIIYLSLASSLIVIAVELGVVSRRTKHYTASL